MNSTGNEKTIYIVFTKTGTWLARTLKYFSATKYVHTSISFDASFTSMYSFGRSNPNNPFSGGFVRENIYDGVFKKYHKSECLIFEVNVSEKQYQGLLKDVERFVTNKELYRYNFLGLFGILFNRPLDRNYHYFCSQFVYSMLKKHGIVKFDKVPGLVQTIDLFEIDNKSILYEGFINGLSEGLSINQTSFEY